MSQVGRGWNPRQLVPFGRYLTLNQDLKGGGDIYQTITDVNHGSTRLKDIEDALVYIGYMGEGKQWPIWMNSSPTCNLALYLQSSGPAFRQCREPQTWTVRQCSDTKCPRSPARRRRGR